MATIRNFQPGDEAVQVAIYNQAATRLPKFKPATMIEVQRRSRVRGFDPSTRFFVEDNGQVVGYVNYQTNGRVSYPWCLPGHEHLAEPLFQRALEAMRERGLRQVFTAYRGDWATVLDFFQCHGFRQARTMVNFVVDLIDMPTPPARPSSQVTAVTPADIPAILQLMPEVLRLHTVAELEKYLFHNPFFTGDALFMLRNRSNDAPVAIGILVVDPSYADPKVVDADMPCYRLGAFGTEGMSTKRINGLFSFLASKEHNINALGLDLLGYAAFRLRDVDDIGALAAQVPSDAPALVQFYQRVFQRQGGFPEWARELV